MILKSGGSGLWRGLTDILEPLPLVFKVGDAEGCND
jgi:hypothetical protein